MRTPENLTLGKALDRIVALRKEAKYAAVRAADKARQKYEERELVLRQMLSQEDQNRLTRMLLAAEVQPTSEEADAD